MLITLRSDWPSDLFRRNGLQFTKTAPVECDADCLKAVAGDLGKALVIVNATTAAGDIALTTEAAADIELFLKRNAPAPLPKTVEPVVPVEPSVVDTVCETIPTPTIEPEPTTKPKRKR